MLGAHTRPFSQPAMHSTDSINSKVANIIDVMFDVMQDRIDHAESLKAEAWERLSERERTRGRKSVECDSTLVDALGDANLEVRRLRNEIAEAKEIYIAGDSGWDESLREAALHAKIRDLKDELAEEREDGRTRKKRVQIIRPLLCAACWARNPKEPEFVEDSN